MKPVVIANLFYLAGLVFVMVRASRYGRLHTLDVVITVLMLVLFVYGWVQGFNRIRGKRFRDFFRSGGE
jgi:hypothetical protein